MRLVSPILSLLLVGLGCASQAPTRTAGPMSAGTPSNAGGTANEQSRAPRAPHTCPPQLIALNRE